MSTPSASDAGSDAGSASEPEFGPGAEPGSEPGSGPVVGPGSGPGSADDDEGPGLRVEIADGTATLTIANPARRNAMTVAMWEALPGLLAPLEADPAVRVLVLTGAGDTFCTGADINDLAGPGGTRQTQDASVAAEEALAAFAKPTLAAIRGFCVGGGCQLAVACDLRFAAEGARFGVTPARLGIVYPASSTRRLLRLTGPATAKHLLFSAELIDDARALRTGLVDEVWPADGLDARVREYAALLGTRSGLTQAAAKEFTAAEPPEPTRVAHWSRQARLSADPEEGVAAYLTRRPPVFTWPVSDR